MEGTTFDTNHPLAKTIIKGCKQGSLVDCFVTSHDFELMGSLDYNQFLDDLDEYDNDQQSNEYENTIDALTKYWAYSLGTPHNSSTSLIRDNISNCVQLAINGEE